MWPTHLSLLFKDPWDLALAEWPALRPVPPNLDSQASLITSCALHSWLFVQPRGPSLPLLPNKIFLIFQGTTRKLLNFSSLLPPSQIPVGTFHILCLFYLVFSFRSTFSSYPWPLKSDFCHFLTLWLWTSYSTSLSIDFPLCKNGGEIITSLLKLLRHKWGSLCKGPCMNYMVNKMLCVSVWATRQFLEEFPVDRGSHVSENPRNLHLHFDNVVETREKCFSAFSM